jgi:general secretion pathway protein C
MEAYIKKHFWVFNLFLTMLVAYSAAGLANHLVLEKVDSILQAGQDSKRKPSKSKIKKKRTNWSTLVAERNLFNANPPSAEEAKEGSEGSSEVNTKPDGSFPEPSDDCEESKISAVLKVTMEAYPVELSHAIIEIDREERIFKIGETIDNKEIVSIQWNGNGGRVVLRATNRYECLRLGKKSKKSYTPSRPSYSKPKRNTKRAKKAQRYKDGIKELSPGKYEVDRAMLNEELENLDKVIRQARVIPYYQKGKSAGFKVVGVRSNSIFRHLGLKSGDVLKSVGGEDLKTVNQALQLFEKLKSSDQVSLDIQRRGKSSNLEYNIK